MIAINRFDNMPLLKSDNHSLSVLPWHIPTYDRLMARAKEGSLGHAYLLAGDEGAGIEHFAFRLAASMLCESEHIGVCGDCGGCHLMQAGSHPDFRYIGLEDSAQLKIAQVRSVIEFGAETPSRGGYRCVVIAPTEAMNVNASNALLKLLEEPGTKTLLLLVSYSLNAIVPTILSRCQKLKLPQANEQQSKEWFGQQSLPEEFAVPFYFQRPLRAAAEANDNGRSHYILAKTAFHDCLAKAIDIQMFLKQTAAIDALALVDYLYIELTSLLRGSSHQLQSQVVFSLLDELVSYKRGLMAGSTVNQSLFYHDWWLRMLSAWRQNR